MLIAADVSKRNPGDAAAWDLLEIERPSAPGENLHRISPRPHQLNRPPHDKNFVLVDPGANKDLVLLPCIQ
jgi:hypothetical protein